jgi:hypothetical protein
VIEPLWKLHSLDTLELSILAGVFDVFARPIDGNRDGKMPYLYDRSDTSDIFRLGFTVARQEFYVFPNPFKHFDPVHAEKGTISFKNISSLKGIDPAKPIHIRIFSIQGDLIFSSTHNASSVTLRQGERVSFPQWDWNLRNRSGRKVASGVYLYVIYSDKSPVFKGKIAVIH